MSTLTPNFNYSREDGTPDWERIYRAAGTITDGPDGHMLYFGRTESEMWTLADHYLSKHEILTLFQICDTWQVLITRIGFMIQEQVHAAIKAAAAFPGALATAMILGQPITAPDARTVGVTLEARLRSIPPPEQVVSANELALMTNPAMAHSAAQKLQSQPAPAAPAPVADAVKRGRGRPKKSGDARFREQLLVYFCAEQFQEFLFGEQWEKIGRPKWNKITDFEFVEAIMNEGLDKDDQRRCGVRTYWNTYKKALKNAKIDPFLYKIASVQILLDCGYTDEQCDLYYKKKAQNADSMNTSFIAWMQRKFDAIKPIVMKRHFAAATPENKYTN